MAGIACERHDLTRTFNRQQPKDWTLDYLKPHMAAHNHGAATQDARRRPGASPKQCKRSSARMRHGAGPGSTSDSAYASSTPRNNLAFSLRRTKRLRARIPFRR